jgi:hypothetical protein
MKKLSIDIAERNGSALRRLLRSAERLSERAMAFGSLLLKTPCCRSSASLRSITLADHFFVGIWLVYPFAPRNQISEIVSFGLGCACIDASNASAS